MALARVHDEACPALRAASRTRFAGSTAARIGETSLPRNSPKPPGSMKSRCMSIMTSAVVSGSNSSGYGFGVEDGHPSASLPSRRGHRGRARHR